MSSDTSHLQRSVNELLLLGNKSNSLVIVIIKDKPSVPSIGSQKGQLTPVLVFATKDYSDHEKSILQTFLTNTPIYSLEQEVNICLIRPALTRILSLAIKLRSSPGLVDHYRNLFQAILQLLCKEVAKIWIKVVEPNKQAKHPYKCCNASKPGWWPQHVNHIEPDHLDKVSRVDLLVSIIRNKTLSLKVLRSKLVYLHGSHKYVKNIFDELFYVAAYERLINNPQRKLDPLFANLSKEDQKALSTSKVIKLPVSDLTATKGSSRLGVVMLNQLEDHLINKTAFNLNDTVKNKPTRIKGSSTRKRTRATTRIEQSEEIEKENCNLELSRIKLKVEEEYSYKFRRTSSLTTPKPSRGADSSLYSQQVEHPSTPFTTPSSPVRLEDEGKKLALIPSPDHGTVIKKEITRGFQFVYLSAMTTLTSNKVVEADEFDLESPPSSPRISDVEYNSSNFEIRTYDSDYSLGDEGSANYVIAQESLSTCKELSPQLTALESWNFDSESSPPEEVHSGEGSNLVVATIIQS